LNDLGMTHGEITEWTPLNYKRKVNQRPVDRLKYCYVLEAASEKNW
jgi:hypothetical protein